MPGYRKRGSDPIHLCAMSVGRFIQFDVPKVEGGFVRPEPFAGEILTFEEVRDGNTFKIAFTIKDVDREFRLRPDYEVRPGEHISGA